MRAMLDVAVVGGGPGGLSAAVRLASAGHHVAVFEEHDVIGAPVHCTGVLAEDALESLDLPLEAVLNPLSTVRFVAPAGHSFDYSTTTTEAVVIDRRIFDDALARRAERAGVRVSVGRRVTAVESESSQVRVSFDSGEPVTAKAAVLACGARYAFQRRLQLGIPSRFLQSAQQELRAEDIGDVEVHFGSEIAPKGFGWAVPVVRPEGQFVRVGVMADRAAVTYFARMVARIRERWRVHVPDTLDPRRKMLPLGSIRRTYTDRVLVVGDAAGLVKPTTGGGIYYSVVSGAIAGDVLGSALAAGDLSSARLASYEQQWRRRFQGEFTAQHTLRFIAQRMRDADIDALFTLASTDGILPLVRQKARFNQHRDFIMALLRHPPARRAMLGRLANSF
jgi:geranylgeranyl reductase family protein